LELIQMWANGNRASAKHDSTGDGRAHQPAAQK